jgi:hypothetical protein
MSSRDVLYFDFRRRYDLSPLLFTDVFDFHVQLFDIISLDEDYVLLIRLNLLEKFFRNRATIEFKHRIGFML